MLMNRFQNYTPHPFTPSSPLNPEPFVMHITRHKNFDSLAPHLASWNDLAGGVPFRRWDWLETWWRHYGCETGGQVKRNRELFVLCVWDENEHLLGIAPWYRLQTRSGSKVIRFLGDGEVCSDYLTVLCRTESEEAVTAALAEWLSQANGVTSDQNSAAKRQAEVGNNAADHTWDRLEFIGVEATDTAVNRLLKELQHRGSIVHHCAAPHTWRIELPASWEEFLMVLSKPHRNRLRKADRTYYQSGLVTLRHVRNEQELSRFFEILIHLHQQRWESKGESGCFASPRFESFHREIATRLFAAGAATLSWLEMDGKPLAAEYRLHGPQMMYAYQCGIDPGRLTVQPGELANMAAVRNAIEHEQKAYDFLRGDEPYKARWRAKPRKMLSVRVVPSHTSARLRHTAWLAGQNVKQWLKRSAKLVRGLKPEKAAVRQQEPAGEVA